MSAETEREGRGDVPYYFDLLANVMREVSAGVYQLVTTTGITDRVMDELREGRPNIPYFDDLWSKVMTYDSGTGKWYLNVSGGGGGGGNLQTTLDAGNTANNQSITLTKGAGAPNPNEIDIDPVAIEIKSSYKANDLNKLSKIDIGGGTDDRISGLLELNSMTRSLGGNDKHRIHAGFSPSGASSFVFTHNIQRENGFLLQNVNHWHI